jgi:alkanesulfonate monooxygenase
VHVGIKVHTYLPTAGETRHVADHPAAAKFSAAGTVQQKISDTATSRKATLDYLAQICLGAEYAGVDSILVPISPACEDPIIASAALIARTSRLKFLSAFRPSLLTPVLFAHMVASYQRFSGNRLALNVTPGLPGHVSHRWGTWLDKAQLLDQAGEFLTIMKGAWSGEPFSFDGTYHHVENASVVPPEVLPPIFYAGSSELSMRFAAEHADVYMSYLEPPDMLEERLDRAQNMAADLGRSLSCAVSFHVIARSTAEEAWAVAAEEMSGVDMSQEALEKSVNAISAQGFGASAARQRLLGALKGDYTKAEISPNLWIGPMLVRGGTGPGLVGSYEEIADRVAEIHQAGVNECLMTPGGSMALEGQYDLAENIIPVLRARGLLDEEPIATTA